MILERLQRWSDIQPGSPALVSSTGSVSYQELRWLVERFAKLLALKALPWSAIVAVEASKSVQTIVMVAALEHLGHPVLIVAANAADEVKRAICRAAGAVGEIVCECGEPVVIWRDVTDEFGTEPVPAGIAPMFILTTSGSTGVPKGVRLPSDGVRNFMGWGQAYFDIAPNRVVLSYAPLNFDLSLLEIWAALDGGATVLLVDGAQAADGHSIRTLVRAHMPHLVQGVPLLFRLLQEVAEATFPFVTDAIITGEAAPPALREAMVRAFPNARFHNVYGATETNDSFIFSPQAAEFGSLETLPIGEPIGSTQYKIVDDESRVVMGAGVGELHTATPFAALGYTNAQLTEQSFYPDGDRSFYRTGDLVERDAAGAIRVLGRRDLVVKVKGVRTNLRDVEIALEKHPSVKNAVVCPLQDAVGAAILHAVVQLEEPVSSLVLRQHCAATLPRSAIPSRFTAGANPLPRTSTGKPDRNAIKRNLEKEIVTENA